MMKIDKSSVKTVYIIGLRAYFVKLTNMNQREDTRTDYGVSCILLMVSDREVLISDPNGGTQVCIGYIRDASFQEIS